VVVREWRGLAKKEMESAYVAHFQEEVLPKLRQLAGFRCAAVLRREKEDAVEVTVLTRWESMDAIRRFAGEDIELAVVAPAAQPCFVSYDKTVSHHEVVLDEEKA
jgi:heme-degrading monooxygenase HmoA